MEYIKKEDLIEGEIYKIFNINIDKYVYFKQNYTTNTQIHHLGFISDYNQYYVKEGYHELLNPNFEITTSEEKHWLNSCIIADKFITFEEAMKTFIPEYVECIAEQIGSHYKVNKIYKVLKDKNNLVEDVAGMAYYHLNQHRFKPSTKEAYDAQFVVKEPEFVLPERWCLKVTDENRDSINNIRAKHNLPPIRYKYLIATAFLGHSEIWGQEITFEQFKKYVLKEEIVEEKVIEPLPQFKVIETIETITKVENNEGNQFFIGDKITIISGDLPHTIKGFKYFGGNMVVITDNTKLDINDIEHYIEPKVEVKDDFILPEKWCITSTLESQKTIFDWLLENTNWKKSGSLSIGNHYCIEGNKCRGWMNYAPDRKTGYTEITFDQFKKYVLKEEVIEESLLDKAKRLYPIGTKFNNYKIAEGMNWNVEVLTTNIIEEFGVIKLINPDRPINNNAGSWTLYKNSNWAEIIK